MTKIDVVLAELIERLILSIRVRNGIIDAYLIRLYGVQTKALNQVVRRNLNRFPEDFAFRVNKSN